MADLIAVLAVNGLPLKYYPFAANTDISVYPPRDPTQLRAEWDLFHPSVLSKNPSALLPVPVSEAFAQAQKLICEREANRGEPLPGDDVEIISLGTGSASPSQFRNGMSQS
jgi:ribonuclease Z